MGRTILNTSSRAPSLGILGETGWIDDESRVNIVRLRLLGSLYRANPESITGMFFKDEWGTSRASPLLSFLFTLVKSLSLNLKLAKSKKTWSKASSNAVVARFTKKWLIDLASSPALQFYSMHRSNLSLPFYCTLPSFEGRALITRARINDLNYRQFFTGDLLTCVCCGLPRAHLVQQPQPKGSDSLLHLLLHCEADPILTLRLDFAKMATSAGAPTSPPLSLIAHNLLFKRPLNSNQQFIHNVGLFLSRLTTLLHELKRAAHITTPNSD